jgi:hypothetical protein
LAYFPVPESATVFAAAPPPGVTFKVADFAPVEVGLNTALTVHEAPAANVDEQVLVNAK